MLGRADITSACRVLNTALEDAQTDLEILRTAPLNDILTDWYLTREEYEALDEVRKSIGKILEGMSRDTIPEVMAEKDTKTVTIASLKRRFTVSQRVSCSIIEGCKDDAYEWLRTSGNEAIIQPTVNSSTLARFSREWIEAGNDLPENLFKLNTMNVTSATKI